MYIIFKFSYVFFLYFIDFLHLSIKNLVQTLLCILFFLGLNNID